MILERYVDGGWWPYGNYDSANSLAKAAYWLGKNDASTEQIRVTDIVSTNKLDRKVNGEWHYYGVYNTIPHLIRACFELGKMGDCCEDLRVTEVQ